MSAVEMQAPASREVRIPSAEELVARARELAPRLRERAVRAERDRNLPPESVQEYIDADMIRTLVPKRWGGCEHDHEVQFDVAIELGRSTCGSSAWVLNYFTDHACIMAHFPEEAQQEVWHAGPNACISTTAAPTGKAEAVSGGYRLNGKWAWSSGVKYAQWVLIGGLVFRDGAHHPDMRLMLVPTSDVTILDTWYCTGLRGTGSNTVQAENLFVPEHRTVSFATLRDAQSPGSQSNTNPIYRTPFIAVHSYALLGPALGVSKGAFEHFVDWTKQRYLTYTTLNIAQHVPVQIKIAEIGAQIDAVETIARKCLATARADYTGMPMETRVLLRRDFCFAMKMLVDAMEALVRISGSSGLLDDNPVQRAWRDVHAIGSHVVMNWDVPAENYGRTLLGLGLNEAYPVY
jgi:3-hydroxy-9,10-secoandrosta-1,3,5(10)-triene-9,17-dione monooxygenase